MQNRTPSRGLSMHPAFVSRNGATPVTDLVRHDRQLCAGARAARERRAALRRGRELRAEGRAVTCCCRPPTARWRRPVRPGRRRQAGQKPLPARPPARPAAGRRLSLRQRAARYAACGARLRARQPTTSAATARPNASGAQLVLPDGVDGADLSRIAEGVALARDLINTPANDIGPAELEQAARALAQRHGASIPRDRRRRRCSQQNFPLIHAVGRAAARARRA